MMIPHHLITQPAPPLLYSRVVGFIPRQRFGGPELLWQSGLPDHWMSGQTPRKDGGVGRGCGDLIDGAL